MKPAAEGLACPESSEEIAVQGNKRNKSLKRLKPRARYGHRRTLVFAGAMVLVAVVCFGAVRLFRSPDPNVLLEKAYTQKRTIELRISGAAYGPMRVKRGEVQSWQNMPEPLLEAEKILKRDAKQHVNDPDWLQAQGRASLLEWDYDGAIRQIDDALMLKPDDLALLQDKATAYFERAEKLGPQRSIDYGEAAEDLSKAIKKKPNDAVSRFNRAIVFEKLYLPNEAITDLEQYLLIDPNGAWAVEAGEKLEGLRKLVKAHIDALAEPLADPVSFVKLASEASQVLQLDQRIENYQDKAIREWLPLAFPVKDSIAVPPATSINARTALVVLAKLLLERHQDKWLSDLLQSANGSRDFALAIKSLAETVAYSATGESSPSLRSAIGAKDLFLKAGNKAGELRAEVEEVHALQRLHQSDHCRKKALIVEKVLNKTSYRWISSELKIDHGACSLTTANFEEGKSAASVGLKQALATEYHTLYLRALGIVSTGNNFEGDLVASWATNEDGLVHFWQQSSSSPVRAHQFYDDLVYSAEVLEERTTALAFAHESANMVASSENKNIEILAREHSARIAVEAEDWDDAKLELAKVSELSKSVHDPAISSRLFSEIILAEIDIRQGRLLDAENRLMNVEPELALVSNVSLNLDFHKAKAQLLSLQRNHVQAESELVLALGTIETSEKLLNDSTDRQSWVQENAALYKALVSEEVAKADPEAAFNVWERYLAAGLDLKKTSGIVNTSSHHYPTRVWLNELVGKTVISYALLPNRLEIFVADNQSINLHEVRLNSADLEKLVAGFLELCADSNSNLEALRVKARQLFDIFISPIANDLSKSRSLMVESDPLIGDLPFQVLLSPNGQYLGEAYTIVVSPGLQYQMNLRQPSRLSVKAKVLVVGSTANLAVNATLLPDENSITEAKEVAERFAGATLLQHETATKEMLEAMLPESEAFHFVGHALSGAMEEGLLLAGSHGATGSNLWTSRQINPTVFRKCQIVVLSACSTGRTYRSHREMHGGMIRGMLAAGVPNIVASRWDVDSVETRRFIQFFYDALLSGKGVPAALREAELQLMHDPKTSHPYYWAAFAAFGHA